MLHAFTREHKHTVYINSTSLQPQTHVASRGNLTRNEHLARFLLSDAEMLTMSLLDADVEFIHNDHIMTDTGELLDPSLGALQSHFHFVVSEDGFGNASFSLEELLHQLLSGAAGP